MAGYPFTYGDDLTPEQAQHNRKILKKRLVEITLIVSFFSHLLNLLPLDYLVQTGLIFRHTLHHQRVVKD